VLLTTRFFDVAKLTSLTPLSLLSSWKLSCLLQVVSVQPIIYITYGSVLVLVVRRI